MIIDEAFQNKHAIPIKVNNVLLDSDDDEKLKGKGNN